MPVIRRAHFLLGLMLGLASFECTPDFDSLSSGHAGGAASGGSATSGATQGGAGAAAQGGTAAAEAGNAGSVSGGSSAGSMGGNDSQGGGSAGMAEMAGMAGVATTDGGEAGAGGAAPTPCQWKPVGSTHYDGFDGGLSGTDFLSATTTAAIVTTFGATASSAWDAAVGKSCPGSLSMEAVFKGYASGQAEDETAIADLRFSDANWNGATKLHGWFRVSPTNAPLTGVQFFVMSGSSYLYNDVFDNKDFATGQWYELVMPLAASATYEPKVVHRIGVQIMLRRDGAANNPPVAPTVNVWLDDVWVE